MTSNHLITPLSFITLPSEIQIRILQACNVSLLPTLLEIKELRYLLQSSLFVIKDHKLPSKLSMKYSDVQFQTDIFYPSMLYDPVQLPDDQKSSNERILKSLENFKFIYFDILKDSSRSELSIFPFNLPIKFHKACYYDFSSVGEDCFVSLGNRLMDYLCLKHESFYITGLVTVLLRNEDIGRLIPFIDDTNLKSLMMNNCTIKANRCKIENSFPFRKLLDLRLVYCDPQLVDFFMKIAPNIRDLTIDSGYKTKNLSNITHKTVKILNIQGFETVSNINFPELKELRIEHPSMLITDESDDDESDDEFLPDQLEISNVKTPELELLGLKLNGPIPKLENIQISNPIPLLILYGNFDIDSIDNFTIDDETLKFVSQIPKVIVKSVELILTLPLIHPNLENLVLHTLEDSNSLNDLILPKIKKLELSVTSGELPYPIELFPNLEELIMRTDIRPLDFSFAQFCHTCTSLHTLSFIGTHDLTSDLQQDLLNVLSSFGVYDEFDHITTLKVAGYSDVSSLEDLGFNATGLQTLIVDGVEVDFD